MLLLLHWAGTPLGEGRAHLEAGRWRRAGAGGWLGWSQTFFLHRKWVRCAWVSARHPCGGGARRAPRGRCLEAASQEELMNRLPSLWLLPHLADFFLANNSFACPASWSHRCCVSAGKKWL